MALSQEILGCMLGAHKTAAVRKSNARHLGRTKRRRLLPTVFRRYHLVSRFCGRDWWNRDFGLERTDVGLEGMDELLGRPQTLLEVLNLLILVTWSIRHHHPLRLGHLQ